MKFSMHNWMRPEPIEITLERLHRYGYDGIEISGEPQRFDTKKVRKLLDKYKLECWGSVTLMFAGRDLIHTDKYVRLGSIQYMKDCLKMVKQLDGKMLCIVPSTVGKVKPMASPEEEWKWAVEGLKEVTDYAGKLGLLCGIEPLNRFETYFINRHDQALLLAKDVGNDCRVVLDAFHLNIEEVDPLAAIRNVGKKLLDFHVADNNRMPAGLGRLDWEAIINTLKSIKFKGRLSGEFVIPMDRTPLAKASETKEADGDDATLKFIQEHGSGLISAADYDRAVEQNINHIKQFV
jgi:D-psicose/D-tagatose/L-ribulose 3-epimerase